MLSVDDVRPRHLSPLPVLLLAGGLLYLADQVFDTAVALLETGTIPPEQGAELLFAPVILGAAALMAYLIASPEFSGRCDFCGEQITYNSTADGVTEYVRRYTKQSPHRLHLGPISIAVSRQQTERAYCSLACGAADPALDGLPEPEELQARDESEAASLEVSD
jgi:hypothetical protein